MSDRCDDVRPLYSAWVDDMLERRDVVRVGAHLRHCPACEEEVQSLRTVRDLLRNLPVRRLPPDVELAPPSPAGPRPAHTTAFSGWSGSQRVAAGLAVAVGLVGGAAFGLGGSPPPEQPVVRVPVDLYVSDHLVHTVGGPLYTPVVVDGRP